MVLSNQPMKHKGEDFSSLIPEHSFIFKFWKVLIPIVLLAGLFWYFILRDLPSPTKLASSSLPQSTRIYDRNGVLLYTIYGNRNQIALPLSSIPKNVQNATIAIEDKSFYQHGPIDLRGIARAAYETVFHKQLQGGSTLTQQLVKNTLLTQDRTLVRKMREIVLAFATEVLFSKDKILDMYLNQIPYGGTAYGIEAASETYFGKHAKDLDLAQSALLAGLPEAPTSYSPFGPHPELAKERQKQVLQAMLDQKYITNNQYNQAVAEPLAYSKISNNIRAPHFVLWVKSLLEKEYGEQTVEEGGLTVKTSLDINIQDFAQNAVTTEVAKAAYAHITNGAALVTNPMTGEILAMVGSKDYFDTTDTDGNVNLTISLRQPGSSIKPINYADGLMHGYTAATAFVDKATCFPNPGQAPYCPVNYDGKFHGLVQMRYALGNSLNIPAVKMLKANGVDSMIATADAMGITSFTDPSRYGLSLTLGGGEVTMVDMATAYGVLANNGYRIDLQPILKVTDNKGNVLQQYTPPTSPIFGTRVLPTGVAYIITNILTDDSARYIDFGPHSQLWFGGQYVAAKTGTTNDFRDNWTFGYTPSSTTPNPYVVAAWVGNNNNSPMNAIASGITGAAPIMHDIMAHLITGKRIAQPPIPDDVTMLPVCNDSGLLPPIDNPNGCPTRVEYFLKGMVPTIHEGVTQNMWVDKATQNPPAPGVQDANLDLKSEQVVTDPVGDTYCITCPALSPTPTPTPASNAAGATP